MADGLGPTTPLRRARWLLGNATAGMHGGTDDATVFNWIYEAYTLLSEAIDGETWADNYTVWVNHQTARALERRGLIATDKQMDGWDLQLIDGKESGR